jgi:hypothetical protein
MREKRGQLEMSFGMIFSIIIIIAILAVSFYVIQYFTKLSTCTSTGLFYDALQKEVDTAWSASSSKQLFSANVPGSADYTCIGNMSMQPRTEDKARFDEIYKMSRLSDANVFFYPQNKGCKTLNSHRIIHMKTNEFFCIKNEGNTVELLIQKDAFDTSVTVSQK